MIQSDPVIHRNFWIEQRLELRGDRSRFPQKTVDEIDSVGRVIGPDIAVQGRVDVPGLVKVRPGVSSQAMPAPDHEYLTQLAAVDFFLHPDILRVYSHLPGESKGDARALDAGDHLIRFAQGERHRFL